MLRVAVFAALAAGCGNGVGQPLRAEELGVGGAGPTQGPTGGATGDVPTSGYCDAVTDWPEEDRVREQAFFGWLNAARETGAACLAGSNGASAGPLSMLPELRCAARLHARDMAENDYLSHTNLLGEDPETRIRRTGHAFVVAAEAIGTTDLAIFGFAASSEDCATLVDSRFDQAGVGVFEGVWTIDLTGP